MKKTKRILAFVSALSLMGTATACGSSNSGEANTSAAATTTSATTVSTPPRELDEEDAEAVQEIDVGEDVQKLENGTVKWLSFWDINPADGKPKGVDLELFETNYGGKIEYIPTTYETRWSDLSTQVLGGTSPDLFPAGENDTFPGKAIAGMFDPFDEYLDFNSDLWTPGAKKLSDQMTLGGKHYVAVISSENTCVCIYNKKTIEENGLKDPAELVKEGNWTWDTFKDLCLEFADPEQDRYALDGWWFELNFILTTGKPAIGMEDGTVVSYLMSPEMERAQSFMLDINKNNLNLPRDQYGWKEQPQLIGEGKTLFYPVGLWQLLEPDLSAFGKEGEIMFVPMPKDPSADAYYLPISTGIDAYNLCKGAPNPEGAAAFLNCRLIAGQDETAKEIQEKQYREDYGWTDEMLEMWDITVDILNENPVIDFFPGASTDINNALLEPLKGASYRGEDWAANREANHTAIQTLLDEINEKIKAEF